MRHLFVRVLGGVCLGTSLLFSAPAHQVYERIICVVPFVGTGTMSDPHRPMFTPGRDSSQAGFGTPSLGFQGAPQILSFHADVSDDKTLAIVEFVAQDRAAFKSILASNQAKVFDRQKIKASDLENELRKYKKTFRLDQFEESAR